MPAGGTATQHTHPKIIGETWSNPRVLLLMVRLFQCCSQTSRAGKPLQGISQEKAKGLKGLALDLLS